MTGLPYKKLKKKFYKLVIRTIPTEKVHKMHYKMTPDEYFRKLIELYFNSREPKYYNPNIFRGRSTSISSELEDLTALFIALNNPNPCNYFTDQPLKFQGSKTKYPDIVIQHENKFIYDLVDMKADTGWNRDGMLKFCEEWEQYIESVKGTETQFINGKTKERHYGKFSKNLKYHVVVATEVNSGKKILEDYELVKEKCTNVELYILSKGVHPNSYTLSQGEVLKKISINNTEFDRLMNAIIKS